MGGPLARTLIVAMLFAASTNAKPSGHMDHDGSSVEGRQGDMSEQLRNILVQQLCATKNIPDCEQTARECYKLMENKAESDITTMCPNMSPTDCYARVLECSEVLKPAGESSAGPQQSGSGGPSSGGGGAEEEGSGTGAGAGQAMPPEQQAAFLCSASEDQNCLQEVLNCLMMSMQLSQGDTSSAPDPSMCAATGIPDCETKIMECSQRIESLSRRLGTVMTGGGQGGEERQTQMLRQPKGSGREKISNDSGSDGRHQKENNDSGSDARRRKENRSRGNTGNRRRKGGKGNKKPVEGGSRDGSEDTEGSPVEKFLAGNSGKEKDVNGEHRGEFPVGKSNVNNPRRTGDTSEEEIGFSGEDSHENHSGETGSGSSEEEGVFSAEYSHEKHSGQSGEDSNEDGDRRKKREAIDAATDGGEEEMDEGFEDDNGEGPEGLLKVTSSSEGGGGMRGNERYEGNGGGGAGSKGNGEGGRGNGREGRGNGEGGRGNGEGGVRNEGGGRENGEGGKVNGKEGNGNNEGGRGNGEGSRGNRKGGRGNGNGGKEDGEGGRGNRGGGRGNEEGGRGNREGGRGNRKGGKGDVEGGRGKGRGGRENGRGGRGNGGGGRGNRGGGRENGKGDKGNGEGGRGNGEGGGGNGEGGRDRPRRPKKDRENEDASGDEVHLPPATPEDNTAQGVVDTPLMVDIPTLTDEDDNNENPTTKRRKKRDAHDSMQEEEATIVPEGDTDDTDRGNIQGEVTVLVMDGFISDIDKLMKQIDNMLAHFSAIMDVIDIVVDQNDSGMKPGILSSSEKAVFLTKYICEQEDESECPTMVAECARWLAPSPNIFVTEGLESACINLVPEESLVAPNCTSFSSKECQREALACMNLMIATGGNAGYPGPLTPRVQQCETMMKRMLSSEACNTIDGQTGCEMEIEECMDVIRVEIEEVGDHHNPEKLACEPVMRPAIALYMCSTRDEAECYTKMHKCMTNLAPGSSDVTGVDSEELLRCLKLTRAPVGAICGPGSGDDCEVKYDACDSMIPPDVEFFKAAQHCMTMPDDESARECIRPAVDAMRLGIDNESVQHALKKLFDEFWAPDMGILSFNSCLLNACTLLIEM